MTYEELNTIEDIDEFKRELLMARLQNMNNWNVTENLKRIIELEFELKEKTDIIEHLRENSTNIHDKNTIKRLSERLEKKSHELEGCKRKLRKMRNLYNRANMELTASHSRERDAINKLREETRLHRSFELLYNNAIEKTPEEEWDHLFDLKHRILEGGIYIDELD